VSCSRSWRRNTDAFHPQHLSQVPVSRENNKEVTCRRVFLVRYSRFLKPDLSTGECHGLWIVEHAEIQKVVVRLVLGMAYTTRSLPHRRLQCPPICPCSCLSHQTLHLPLHLKHPTPLLLSILTRRSFCAVWRNHGPLVTFSHACPTHALGDAIVLKTISRSLSAARRNGEAHRNAFLVRVSTLASPLADVQTHLRSFTKPSRIELALD
jgi:hypothetical protein